MIRTEQRKYNSSDKCLDYFTPTGSWKLSIEFERPPTPQILHLTRTTFYPLSFTFGFPGGVEPREVRQLSYT